MILSFFLNLFGLEKQDVSRVIQSFLLVFLARFGFVLGWAVVIAMFLEAYGLSSLPLFFLIDALLVLVTNYLFQFLDERYSTQVWIGLFIIASSFLIFLGASFLSQYPVLALICIILAHSFFLSKFNMVFSVYLEENFTASESQRTLPIIESGEILGSLLAGLGLAFLTHFFSPHKFLMLWVLALLLMIPIVFRSKKSIHTHLVATKEQKAKVQLNEKHFMLALLILFFLQWFAVNLIEYLYAFSVVNLGERSQGGFTGDFFLTKIGYIQSLVSALSLILQFIFSSRILKHFGVLESLKFQSILTGFFSIGAFIWPNFMNIFIVKSSFDTGAIIFKSAYDNALYGVPHSQRLAFREKMYGIMKPMGAIVASLCILVLAQIPQKYIGIVALLNLSFILSIFASYAIKKNFFTMHKKKLGHHGVSSEINFLELLSPKDFILQEEKLKELFNTPKLKWAEWMSLVKLCLKHQEVTLIPILVTQISKGDAYAERILASLEGFPIHSLKKVPFTKEFIFNHISPLLTHESIFIARRAFHVLYALDSYALSNYFFEWMDSKPKLKNQTFLFKDPSLALEVSEQKKVTYQDLLKLSTQTYQKSFILDSAKKMYRDEAAWYELCIVLDLKGILPFLLSKKTPKQNSRWHYYTLLYFGYKEALPLYIKSLKDEASHSPQFLIEFYQLEESIQESLWALREES